MWFWMIIKVAIRVLKGGDADDIRSDDEGEAEEELGGDDDREFGVEVQTEEKKELLPFEEEVGVESINFKGRANGNGVGGKRYRKGASSATGVSIAGHSVDRKELLGRIGCDKGV